MADETDEALIDRVEDEMRMMAENDHDMRRIFALARRGAATMWRPIEEFETGDLKPLNAVLCNKYGGKVMAQSDKWGDWYIENDCGDKLYVAAEHNAFAYPLQPHYYIPVEALEEPGK
jgi:hypothetical protein